jgi:MFS family permease
VFLSGLDQTVVVSILPRIVADLHLSINALDEAAWLVTAYLVGYTAALPLLGRLADVHGYRTLFVACAAVFAVGSLWAATETGLWGLVAARGVQAIGGGGMVPVALAAAAVLLEGRQLVIALGAITGAAEAGAVLGPLYGALMVDAFGWRSVFWVNIPLSVALVALVLWWLPARPRADPGRVDYVGGFELTLALLALALGLSGGGVGVTHAFRLLCFAIAAGSGVAFVLRERVVRRPLIPLRLFGDRAFSFANASNVLVGSALIVALVEVPLFANVVLHESTTAGGLELLRLTVFIPVGAVVGGRLGARHPFSLVGLAGMLASAAGFVLLSRWDASTSGATRTAELALTGLGFGLILAPLAGSVLGAARGGSEAVGAATLTIARMIGMMIGLASLTTWGLAEFHRRVDKYRLPLPKNGQSDRIYHRLLTRYQTHVADGALFVFDRLFLVAAVLCLAAGVLCLWLRAPAHEPLAAEPEQPVKARL